VGNGAFIFEKATSVVVKGLVDQIETTPIGVLQCSHS
jgi:hypothetical protein